MKDRRHRMPFIEGVIFCTFLVPSLNEAQTLAQWDLSAKVVVRSFEAEGNRALKTDFLRKVFSDYFGWPIPAEGLQVPAADIQQFVNQIERIYHGLGYKSVTIDVPEKAVASAVPLALVNDALRLVIREVKEVYGEPAPEEVGEKVRVRSLEVEGNTLVSAEFLEGVFHDYMGWPVPDDGLQVSPLTLRDFLQQIVRLYQAHGYSAIAAYVPKENVTSSSPLTFKDDVLKVEIVEGKVAEVSASYSVRKRWRPWRWGEKATAIERKERHEAKEDKIVAMSPVQQGTHVSWEPIDEYVDFMERQQGRTAAAVVKKAEREAGSDDSRESAKIEYRVFDEYPLSVYTQVNNTGSESTGELRARVGISHNDLSGRDDSISLSFQAAAEEEIENNFGVFATYDTPLWDPHWRGRLYGGYSEFETFDIVGPDTSFIGDGYVIGEEITHNLWQSRGWFFDLFENLEFQASGLDNPFGGGSEVNLLDLSLGACPGPCQSPNKSVKS